MATLLISLLRLTDQPDISPSASPSISLPNCTHSTSSNSYILTWPEAGPLTPLFACAPTANLLPSSLKLNPYGRFIFALGGRFGVIEADANQIECDVLADERSLYSRLKQKTNNDYLYVDGASPRLSLLRELIETKSSGTSVAIVPGSHNVDTMWIYLRDGGSIHRFAQPKRPLDEVAAAWLLFFSSRIHDAIPKILTSTDAGLTVFRPTTVRLPFRLSVEMHVDETYTVKSTDRKWQGVSLDNKIFAEIIEHTLAQRRAIEIYPIYFTEVILPASLDSLSASMRLKARLESRLWAEMKRVTDSN